MESRLEQWCDCDYELIQDIQGRMILHWNYRNLREIPNEVLNHGEHIEEIYLKRNCLEKLPSSIGKLKNLTNLYLVGNQLEGLPSEIGQLQYLRVLDISNNYVRKLPSTIGDLGLLESFLITYNQLEELPKCLKHLHRLKQLEVSGNRIYSIPSDVIEGLHALEEFGIDRNPISALPRNICLLRNLRYFSACRCNLLLLPSLPFHSLFNSSRGIARSSRTQSNNVNAINCNRNLQFLFDGNPRLNYIPYWILQLLGTSVECFGCGLDPGECDNGGANPVHPHETTTAQANTQLQLYTYWSGVNRPKIKLNFKGKRRTLHFDEDISKLHYCGFNGNVEGTATEKVVVVSLLEMCLRQVHQQGLLDGVDQMRYGVKPVVEPLIVPQRTGNSLINIRGDSAKKDNEAAQEVGLAVHDRKSSSNNSCDTFKGVLPSSSSSLTCSEKAGQKSHRPGLCSQCPERETGSTASADKDKQKNHNAITSTEEDALSLILPPNLRKILRAGPVAKCFECLKPIFTESWPIVFHIPSWVFDENVRERMRLRGGGENDIQGDWDDMHDGKLSIGCTHFCSAPCVTSFQRSTKLSSNLVLNDLRCIVENELQWTNG